MLTVTTGSAGVFSDNFNLFSPNAEDATNGMIYEPLFFYDTAKSGSVQPWLGTSATWSNGGASVTVQLRHNVTWTDGTPFTSADVVYTFEQAINNKALNKFGLPLASVTANGSYSVTINFTSPAYSDAYYALGRVEILPKHIWQSISNPTTTLNAHPVGTGAYELSSISGETMTFTANPHYYLPGLPKFKTIRFISYNSNTSSDAAIENGTIDWAGSYIPDIQKLYLGKNPKYAVSDIPLSTAFLVPNMASGPTANLAVRQAISAALNRTYISNTVYNGYALGRPTPRRSSCRTTRRSSARRCRARRSAVPTPPWPRRRCRAPASSSRSACPSTWSPATPTISATCRSSSRN